MCAASVRGLSCECVSGVVLWDRCWWDSGTESHEEEWQRVELDLHASRRRRGVRGAEVNMDHGAEVGMDLGVCVS